MSTAYAEASKPQKKMQECNKCKSAGFPNQQISFEKIGQDPATGKLLWKLIDENGQEHKHKAIGTATPSLQGTETTRALFKRRRIIDIATVTSVEEAKRLLSLGWDYQTSYPATIASVPHYVLVRKE